MAIEKTDQFKGTIIMYLEEYFLQLMEWSLRFEIASLEERVKSGEIKEVILALSATMEGDTTNFYIYRKLQPYNIKVSIIARGVSIGDEIEYADEVTLGRSILNRTPFDESFNQLSK